MEELKLLIEMVTNLPSLAIWVLVGYLLYKISVIGSLYGLLRLLIIKGHDWLTSPRIVKFAIGAKALDESTAAALNAQILRISGSSYIHMSDVEKLRKAIDSIGAK
jgi:hypothetical protein